METITQLLDREFPKELEVTAEVTMEHLATMKIALKTLLPPDSLVELSLVMNVVLLTVFVSGENKTYRRTCTIRSAR